MTRKALLRMILHKLKYNRFTLTHQHTHNGYYCLFTIWDKEELQHLLSNDLTHPKGFSHALSTIQENIFWYFINKLKHNLQITEYVKILEYNSMIIILCLSLCFAWPVTLNQRGMRSQNLLNLLYAKSRWLQDDWWCRAWSTMRDR